MGSNVFFTADTHFGHANIIKYCSRPFGDVAEMDEALISRWNAVVGKADTVYHLGDFAFAQPERYLNRLNGHVHLVVGNHDHRRSLKGLRFVRTVDMLYLKDVGPEAGIVLCHYAMRVWNRSHHGAWMLYGHSHGTLPPVKNSFDVGVDANLFAPLSLDEVAAKIAGGAE